MTAECPGSTNGHCVAWHQCGTGQCVENITTPPPRATASTITDTQLDALYDELAELRAVARGYCPACGRGDAAPTVEDWEQQKQRADEAEQRLRNIAQGGPRAEAVQAEIGEMIAQTHELRDQLAKVAALRDDLRGITGARWIADTLDTILDGSPPAPAPAAAEATDTSTRVRQLETALGEILDDAFDGMRNSDGLGDIEHYQARVTPGEYARWRAARDGVGRTESSRPDLAEQLRSAIDSEIYEYRERTMFWEETGGVTEEITRLAVRGAMTILNPGGERNA